jgi:hypothetical protein
MIQGDGEEHNLERAGEGPDAAVPVEPVAYLNKQRPLGHMSLVRALEYSPGEQIYIKVAHSSQKTLHGRRAINLGVLA